MIQPGDKVRVIDVAHKHYDSVGQVLWFHTEMVKFRVAFGGESGDFAADQLELAHGA